MSNKRASFPIYYSFIFRFIALYTLLVFIFFGLTNYWSFYREQQQTEDQFSELAKAVAVSVAPFISAVDLDKIHSNKDAKSPAFQRIRSILERAKEDNHLEEDQIYILRKNAFHGKTYFFVAMLQEKTFIGDPYTPPERVQILYQKTWQGKAQKTPRFKDENGEFISALAPIYDQNGKVVALLEVDRDLREYLIPIREEAKFNIFLIFLFTLLLLSIGWGMHRYLQRHVNYLLEGTHAIYEQAYSHRIPITSTDELGELGKALNLALQNLAERFEMLKFIPQHTLKMITAALDHQKGVDLSLGRRINVIVMETDIRGFTALSEHLPPEDTIKLINHYISAQAEIVLQHGGSIDKYMGDAVLVIFEGEKKEERALHCAFQIQQTIHQINFEQSAPIPQKVEIGVGISTGEVVMGNMGCLDRMEHTVIGATVNLAARLCSAARRGEIVVQREILPKHKEKKNLEFIPVKGFSEDIGILRFTQEEIISHLKAESLHLPF